MRGGGWFPAVIPMATVEHQRFGVSFGLVPSYRDRLLAGYRSSSRSGRLSETLGSGLTFGHFKNEMSECQT